MDISEFKKQPILGILRGVEADAIEDLMEAVSSSGLKTIEITMNTKDAPALIRRTIKSSRGRLAVGAGTVLNMDSLKAALDAGATFIVLPVLIEDVVGTCVKNGIPVFPGAFTPQEIHRAWEAGATMVKVFPAGFLGAAYFKEIKGPFEQIELLACGGVRPENMKEYFSCGASAIAFGSSVFKKEWLTQGEFNAIGDRIKDFIRRLN